MAFGKPKMMTPAQLEQIRTKDFFDCIKNDREPKIPLKAGIVSLEMAASLKESAELGLKIDVF